MGLSRLHLPRDARDTLFLLGVVGWTVLPHTAHLPLWCSALTGLVLLWRGTLAVRGDALPSRWWVIAVLAAAVVMTLATHRTLLGKEAGVTLLVVLVALKTLELRARRDAFAVFFLGFFLVLTHFLYSQSIATAAAMLVSVWGLLTALVLAHMPVGQPSLAQAARLAGRFALLGAPVMALLFVLFPRVGPLWGVPQDAGARTGLSGTLEMGAIAELALDDSIALRLRVLQGSAPAPETLYFRGPVLGAFDGRSWRMLRQGPDAEPPAPGALRPRGEPLELEVTLEPLRLATLPTLELTPELPALEGVRARLRADLHWSTERPVTERLRYTARAWPRFTHGPTEPERALRQHVELPAGHNPRLLAWADALRRAAPEADASGIAALMLRHLRGENYRYTLSPGVYDEDGNGDALDEFWFERRAGFCEHYAAAFVVALRAADVPARIVTGYQGAERNPVDGSLVVRQSHAHAWAEYWQPGVGWLRADPTAAVAPERVERGLPLAAPRGLVAGAFDAVAPRMLGQLRALWEATNNRWNQWVLNYTRGQQRDLLRELGFEAPSWQDLALVLLGVLSGCALLGAAWAWWDQQRADPWLRAYARVRRAAAAHGIAAHAALPPRALAAALRERHGAAAAEAAAALHALDALRYGRRAPRRAGATARRLARDALHALRALPLPPSDAAAPAVPQRAPVISMRPLR